MKKTCSVCSKPLASQLAISTYCPACRRAIAQVRAQAVRAMHAIHFKPPDVPCVDCGARATCWDHRYYSLPLEVDPVCSACNTNRGPALDAVQLARELLNLRDPAEPPILMSLPDRLDQAERQAIEQALKDAKYNMAEAARQLGINYRSMRHRVNKLGIKL